MSLLLLLLAPLGLAAEPAPTVQADLDHLLIQRHDPGCQAMLAAGPADDVRAALAAATEREAPPWAAMRAAGCLAELAATDAVAWELVPGLLQVEGKPGLALAVLQHIDVLPVDKAVTVATIAGQRSLGEPRFARLARPHLTGSLHVEVRQLAPSAQE